MITSHMLESCKSWQEREMVLEAQLLEQTKLTEIELIKVRAEHADTELAFIGERNKAVATWASAAVRIAAWLSIAGVASAALLGVLW